MISNQVHPLELVEESRISWAEVESLASESGIEEEMFSWVPQCDQGRQGELFTAFKLDQRAPMTLTSKWQ